MKTCKTCGIEKEETEFFKKKFKWLEGSCKQCRKIRAQELIEIDPEAHREKERLRSEHRRVTDEYKEWRKNHQSIKREEISKKSREIYNKNERTKDLQRIWRQKNREKVNASVQRHKKRYPFKHAARVFVCAAIKEGILVRPLICSICLKECKPDAHHKDYMKPLDVIWLCRACHRKEHRKY